MKTSRSHILLATAVTLLGLLASCTTSHSEGDNAGGQDSDTIAAENVQTLDDGLTTLKGVAVDGSRRNIYIKVNEDTIDYELPPASDFTWSVGDSVLVVLQKTEHGDSIAQMTNLTIAQCK